MEILAFDIGGSKISSAIISEQGKLLSSVSSILTPKNAEEIKSFLEKKIKLTECQGVAVATAGVVNQEKLIAKPHNLPQGYENINFHKLTDKPVLVENDANSALWAEYQIGVLKGTKYAVMLTLGTGVGCGILCNGEILRGKVGAAGEVPFLVSGRDLADIAQKNGLNEKDCFKLCKLKEMHNIPAEKTFAEWQSRLVKCVALLNSILDTEIVALSGSLSKIIDYSEVESLINKQGYHNPLMLKKAETGTNAGLIGAALLLEKKIYG